MKQFGIILSQKKVKKSNKFKSSDKIFINDNYNFFYDKFLILIFIPIPGFLTAAQQELL